MTHGYWKGYIVEVIAEVPNDERATIVRVRKNMVSTEDADYNINRDFLASRIDIEPIAWEMFEIGDSVKYTKGDYKGVVVGYDYEANEVITKSVKLKSYKNDRTRYSYKVTELEKYDPDAYTFTQGAYYKVNGEKLMAVESVFEPDEVMLFKLDGTIKYKNVPRKASLKYLGNHFHIASVKLLEPLK
jgi:hypothetical protein